MFTQMPLMPPQPHHMELLLTINNLLAKTSRPTLRLGILKLYSVTISFMETLKCPNLQTD